MDSSPPSQKPNVSLSLGLQSSLPPHDGFKPQERSLKLIQLLLTCANHASSGNLHHADACLRQVSELSSITGDSMQRLAARFSAALAARLVKRWPGLYKALTSTGYIRSDLDRARTIFNRVFPYMDFAYAILSRTLVQSMREDRVIHVIGLGCSDPKLWIPFIRGVADGPNGPPHVKITCVCRDKEAQERLLMVKVVKEAKSLNIPFSFNPVNANLGDVTLEMLDVQSGEALALVSILGLHVLLAEDDRVDAHFGFSKSNEVKKCKKMDDFLKMIKSTGPKVVLVVEQESNHNSGRLVDRFVEALHFYSALFDSIDVAFGGFSCKDRTALEDMFGKEIEDVVAGEGLEREERHERFASWVLRFGRVGFGPVRLWYDCLEEAQKLEMTFGPKGFKIVSENGILMICWHDRPIYAVSSWTCSS